MTEDTPVNEIDPISTALREIARADAATHGRSVEELMRGAVNLGADGIHLSARDIAGILAVMDEAGANAISMADRVVELSTRVAELEAEKHARTSLKADIDSLLAMTPAPTTRPLTTIGRYRHYKGGEYDLLTVGKHTETGEEFVIYRSCADGRVWVRPLNMFEESVVYGGVQRPRFTKIDGGPVTVEVEQ